MKHATLCNVTGETQCGTDGHIYIDGRFGLSRALESVRQYRAGFKANFPHKFNAWTHVVFSKKLADTAGTKHPL